MPQEAAKIPQDASKVAQEASTSLQDAQDLFQDRQDVPLSSPDASKTLNIASKTVQQVRKLFQKLRSLLVCQGHADYCQLLAKSLPGSQVLQKWFVHNGQARRPTAKAMDVYQGWSGGVCPLGRLR